MIYTFIYSKENVFPKYAFIFQTLQKFDIFVILGRFSSMFLSNVVRMDSSVGFSKN